MAGSFDMPTENVPSASGPEFIAPRDEVPRADRSEREGGSTASRKAYRRRVVAQVAREMGVAYRRDSPKTGRETVDAYLAGLPERVRARISAGDLRRAYLSFDVSPAGALQIALEAARRRRVNAPAPGGSVPGDFGAE